MIDGSPYGLKTSAAIFHESLSKLIARLRLRKSSMNLIYG
jgi:hypothetical protein